jgi:hypothetical protein
VFAPGFGQRFFDRGQKDALFCTIVDHASKHRPVSLRIGEYQMRKKFEGFIDINLDL